MPLKPSRPECGVGFPQLILINLAIYAVQLLTLKGFSKEYPQEDVLKSSIPIFSQTFVKHVVMRVGNFLDLLRVVIESNIIISELNASTTPENKVRFLSPLIHSDSPSFHTFVWKFFYLLFLIPPRILPELHCLPQESKDIFP